MSCLLSELYESREYCKKTKNSALNIKKIRDKLREYDPEHFEINEKADSMEALFAIFEMLHKDYQRKSRHDTNLCDCISHKNFGLFIIKTINCEFGNQTIHEETLFYEYLRVSEVLYNTSINDKLNLVMNNKIHQEESKVKNSMIELICQEKQNMGFAECENCHSQLRKIVFNLIRIPKVYLIQLIWPKRRPGLRDILQFLKSLNEKLDLLEIYSIERSTNHVLRGMIVHLKSHYVYLIRSETGKWTMINDSFSKIINSGE